MMAQCLCSTFRRIPQVKVLQYLEVSPARLSPDYLLLLDKADDLHFGTTVPAFEGIYLPDFLNTLPPGRSRNL